MVYTRLLRNYSVVYTYIIVLHYILYNYGCLHVIAWCAYTVCGTCYIDCVSSCLYSVHVCSKCFLLIIYHILIVSCMPQSCIECRLYLMLYLIVWIIIPAQLLLDVIARITTSRLAILTSLFLYIMHELAPWNHCTAYTFLLNGDS